MSTLQSDKQEILDRIIREENISKEDAEKTLRRNIQNIKHIITLWDYFLWCKKCNLLNDFVLEEENHKRMLNIIKEKPYYDKSPYLSLSVHDVILMSDDITYTRYVKERDVKKKHPLHSIFLLDKKEMDFIQSILQ